jgi:glucose-6-phosphate isomerase
MLGINPFDQYGVNAGKIAAQKKLQKIRDNSGASVK